MWIRKKGTDPKPFFFFFFLFLTSFNNVRSVKHFHWFFHESWCWVLAEVFTQCHSSVMDVYNGYPCSKTSVKLHSCTGRHFLLINAQIYLLVITDSDIFRSIGGIYGTGINIGTILVKVNFSFCPLTSKDAHICDGMKATPQIIISARSTRLSPKLLFYEIDLLSLYFPGFTTNCSCTSDNNSDIGIIQHL